MTVDCITYFGLQPFHGPYPHISELIANAESIPLGGRKQELEARFVREGTPRFVCSAEKIMTSDKNFLGFGIRLRMTAEEEGTATPRAFLAVERLPMQNCRFMYSVRHNKFVAGAGGPGREEDEERLRRMNETELCSGRDSRPDSELRHLTTEKETSVPGTPKVRSSHGYYPQVLSYMVSLGLDPTSIDMWNAVLPPVRSSSARTSRISQRVSSCTGLTRKAAWNV